jgi:PKD repeat protein
VPNQLEGEVVVGPFSPRPGFPDWLQAVIFYRPAANTAPGVEDIPNQTTTWGTPVGPVSFTVSDAETAAGALTVTATSSNQTVLPDANISLGGSGATRTITLTPVVGQAGTATVTVSVEDGGALSTQDTFTLTVTAAAPVASFTGTPTSGTDPVSVTFTDASTNSPTSWLWERNSGGGWTTFSTSQNPTQAFAAGTWSVRLTATNAGGSNTQTRTNYLAVAAAGIALVSHTIKSGSSGGLTTNPINTTGATLLVVAFCSWENRGDPAITDSKGNTYTFVPGGGYGAGSVRIAYCANPVVGSGHTMTLTGGECYASGEFSAWSGVATSSPLDVSGASNNINHINGGLTPSQNGELIVSAAGTNWNAGTPPNAVNSPFTLLEYVAGVGDPQYSRGLGFGYLIQTTAANVDPTWPTTVGVVGAAFKKA